MPVSPLWFGHNIEITRRSMYGGLYSERLCNHRLTRGQDGVPLGWTSDTATGRNRLCQRGENLTFPAGQTFVFRARLQDNTPSLRLRIRDCSFNEYLCRDLTPASGSREVSCTFAFVQTRLGTVVEASWEKGGGPVCLSIREQDSFHGARRDVLDALCDLRPGLLRYPGGCFAEYFHWKDSLLPPDERPDTFCPDGLPFLLPYTFDRDATDIGVDDFLAICEYVGAQPAITVRFRDNEPQDAAEWVEYCNGAPDTPWGRVRAERGHAEPYRVRYWFVGNELALFGQGELREDGAAAARQTKEFLAAMRAVDPDIVTIESTFGERADWNAQMLSEGLCCDAASVHCYIRDRLGEPVTPEDCQRVLDAPWEVLEPMLREAAGWGKQLSFDEWNFEWGGYGSALTALYAAGVLHLLMARGEALGLLLACYFTPLNEGAIRITPFGAELHADGAVFAMLAHHAGAECTRFERRERLSVVETDNGVLSCLNADLTRPYPCPDAGRTGQVVRFYAPKMPSDDLYCELLERMPDTVEPASLLVCLPE